MASLSIWVLIYIEVVFGMMMFEGNMILCCISYALIANLMNCSRVMLKASSVLTSYQIYFIIRVQLTAERISFDKSSKMLAT